MLNPTVIFSLALAVVFAFPPSASAQEKPVEAWWLSAAFVPSASTVEAIPVNTISPTWVKVSLLSYAGLPADSKADLRWMRRDGYAFQVKDQFRVKDAHDRELCGVYEDRKGRKGRFLLVLTRSGAETWKVAYLHQESGQAGFSILLRKANVLYWSTCMQCSEFNRLRLTATGFTLEQAP